MDKKKITRRVAVGVAVGGLAVSPFILNSLRGKYEVNLPSDPTQTAPVTLRGTVTTTVAGVTVGPIEIPETEIRTPEDRKRYDELRNEVVARAVESDPRVARARENKREEAWEEGKERYRAAKTRELEELASKQLEEVANSSLGEQEKKREEERIKETLASKKRGLEKLLEEMKDRPQSEKQTAELTQDQERQHTERFVKSVEASVKKSLEKQFEGKQISAEEKERIIEERTREAVELALKRLESRHSTGQGHD